MVFIIEGLQNVGKSTLIKNLKFKKARFAFDKYIMEYNLFSEEELNSFQIAKDFGILFGLNFLPNKKIVILDRGPISTIYYSIKENRKLNQKNLINLFLKEISIYENIHYIFILKNNAPLKKEKRNKQDGFDYLNDDEDNDKDIYLSELFKFIENSPLKNKFTFFNNDFSKSLKENTKNLERLILEVNNEHKRNPM